VSERKLWSSILPGAPNFGLRFTVCLRGDVYRNIHKKQDEYQIDLSSIHVGRSQKQNPVSNFDRGKVREKTFFCVRRSGKFGDHALWGGGGRAPVAKVSSDCQALKSGHTPQQCRGPKHEMQLKCWSSGLEPTIGSLPLDSSKFPIHLARNQSP
jgi:hypothetical protein